MKGQNFIHSCLPEYLKHLINKNKVVFVHLGLPRQNLIHYFYEKFAFKKNIEKLQKSEIQNSSTTCLG